MSSDRDLPAEIAIVWSPIEVAGKPKVMLIAAYINPAIAQAHANTMLGAKVDTLELRLQLPEHVTDDLASDFACDESDLTPEVIEVGDPPDTIVIDVSDLDEV